MAQINRYSRPAQVAKFDPMSAEEIMAVPLMKQQIEDQQMTDQRALLKDLYNVQGVQGDQARVNAKKDALANRLQDIATDITTNGVSAKKTQAFNALKGEYDKEMSLTGELGQAGAYLAKQQIAKKNFYTAPGHKNWSKAQLDAAWEIDAAKRSAFDGDEFVQDYEEYGLTSSPTLSHYADINAKNTGSSVIYDKAGNAITSNEGQLKILSEQMRGNLLQEGTEEHRIAQQMGLDPINNDADYLRAANEIERKLAQLAKTTGGKKASSVSTRRVKNLDNKPDGDTGQHVVVDEVEMQGLDIPETKEGRQREYKLIMDKKAEAEANGDLAAAEEYRMELLQRKSVVDRVKEIIDESSEGIKAKFVIKQEEEKLPKEFTSYMKELDEKSYEELAVYLGEEVMGRYYKTPNMETGPDGTQWSAPTQKDRWKDVGEKAFKENAKNNLLRQAAKDKAAKISPETSKAVERIEKLKIQRDNLIDGKIGGNNAHYTTNMWAFKEAGVTPIDKAAKAWGENMLQSVKEGTKGYTILKGVDSEGNVVDNTPEEWRALLSNDATFKGSRTLGFIPANAFNDNMVKIRIEEDLPLDKSGKKNIYTIDVELDMSSPKSSPYQSMYTMFGNASVERDQLIKNAADHNAYYGIVPTIGDKPEEEGGYSSSDQILKHFSEDTFGKELLGGISKAEIYRNPENDMFKFKYKNAQGKEQHLTYGQVTMGIPWGNVEAVNKWVDMHPNVIASLIGEIKKTDEYKKVGKGLPKEEYDAAIQAFYVKKLQGMATSSKAIEFQNHYNLMHILK